MASSARELHVIFGTGPLGLAVMRELRSQSRRVRLINRSGRVAFEKDQDTDVRGGDASDPKLTREACEGASAVYHCVGLPYPQWAAFPSIARGIIEGAASAGARLVYGDNVYAYGPVRGPLREGLPETATTIKGRIRAEVARLILGAHAAGGVQAAIGRASDFFGPGVTDSSMLGTHVFGRLIAGKPAQVVGNPDKLHSYTFIDDFGRALATLGQREGVVGQIWHVPTAPARTTREMVALIAGKSAKVSALPRWMVSMAGLFDAQVRELKEMLYEFEEDFVLDSSRFEQSFGVKPTPLEQSLRATLDWYRARSASLRR